MHTCTLHRMRVTSTSLYCIVCYCTFQLGWCHSFVPAQRTCSLITSTSASSLNIFRLICRQEILLIIIFVEYLNKEVNWSFFFSKLTFLFLFLRVFLCFEFYFEIYLFFASQILWWHNYEVPIELKTMYLFIINVLHFIKRDKL